MRVPHHFNGRPPAAGRSSHVCLSICEPRKAAEPKGGTPGDLAEQDLRSIYVLEASQPQGLAGTDCARYWLGDASKLRLNATVNALSDE